MENAKQKADTDSKEEAPKEEASHKAKENNE